MATWLAASAAVMRWSGVLVATIAAISVVERSDDGRAFGRRQGAGEGEVGRDVGAAGHHQRTASAGQGEAAVGIGGGECLPGVELAVAVGVGEHGGARDVAVFGQAAGLVRVVGDGDGDVAAGRDRGRAVVGERGHVQVERCRPWPSATAERETARKDRSERRTRSTRRPRPSRG